ncbi:MAG: hypothetical protein ACLSTO_03950 [Bilophila wadsworthia]
MNDHLEAAEGVYAIGDVNGLTLLAHAADHQGAYVARRILGHEKAYTCPARSRPAFTAAPRSCASARPPKGSLPPGSP